MELPMFYDEEEEWNRALLLYDSALKEVNTKLEILNNEFKLAHQYNPIEHITSRIKSPQSIAKKMRHNQRELTVENIARYINDVAGIRVICSFTSDIYHIANLIANQSDVKVLKVKDYIQKPKPNGYTSYHMIVSVPIFLSNEVIPTKVEIQIRTIAMDFWASLEHKMYYKFEGNAPTHIRRELKECADLVSFLDQKMLAINEEIKTFKFDATSEYKELVTEIYKDKIKEAYGTVIDDDDDAIETIGIEPDDTQEISEVMKPLSTIDKNTFVIDIEQQNSDDMLSSIEKKIKLESESKKDNDVSEIDLNEKLRVKKELKKQDSGKIPFPSNIFIREKKKKREIQA